MKINENIELINGDCFEINKSISSESIDLILTDPPYGMSYQSGIRKEKHDKIANDDNLDWLPDWFKEQYRILKNNSHAYIFCSWHNIDKFKKYSEESGFNLKNILIWEKPGGFIGDLEGDYGGIYEMILFLHKGRKILNGKRISNIIRCKKTKNNNHPTEKPTEILEMLIEKSSEKGDLVLDNFYGSGSCAIACHNTHRRFLGHEIDAKRHESAVKRLSLLLQQNTLF